jgi:hypothetical protein
MEGLVKGLKGVEVDEVEEVPACSNGGRGQR